MTRRLWPLALLPALLRWLAAPRPSWFGPWMLGQISEVPLTPDQLEVMAARIRAHFGQSKDRP